MTNLVKKIETATDNNEHGEAAMLGARALIANHTNANLDHTVVTAYLTVLEEIQANHELQGSINPVDQILRDTIAKKITQDLVLFGLI